MISAAEKEEEEEGVPDVGESVAVGRERAVASHGVGVQTLAEVRGSVTDHSHVTSNLG